MKLYPLNRNRLSWICLSVGFLGILMTTGVARGQATGACCVGAPPLCQITSAADCSGLGGIYFGDGSLCNPNPCEARGACCFFQQGVMMCAELTEADCLAQGGTYQGDATFCIQVNCPLIGACCITGPAPPTICLITTVVDCQAQGGLYQGDGTTCTPDPCDVIGACCIQDAAGIFTCFLTTAFECQIQGGTYFGDGTPCTVDLCAPTGACCIQGPAGGLICIQTTAVDCQQQGGTYFGDGTPCAVNLCDPTGACCIQDAAGGFTCIITTAADCQSQNGTYFGDSVPCIQAQCPPPVVGACCYDDPFTGMIVCSVMLQIDCQLLGGIYQGDGTNCTPPNPCAPPTGACCVDDPTGIGQVCIITTAVDCAVQNGIYWGDGSTCTPDPCNDPTGACCIETAAGGWTCVILTQIDCDANGGMYQGDFVPCTANLCPDPKTGACCIPVPGTPFFACITTTAPDCQIQGGIYQGNGVPCLPDPCPPLELTGACCYVDAAGVSQCATMTAGDCQTIGGIYQGDGVPCIPLPIDCNPPPPSGACCITDAAGVFICIITTQIDCLLQGGIYQGDGVPCTPDPCTPPDPCGDPGAGPCFTANGSPGCDDPQCCKQICAIDPFCCTVDWDVNCVALAVVICPVGPPPCDNPLVFKCTAGQMDNFDLTDGPEPSSPSAPLLAVMNACSLGALTQFDVVPDNRCFGHTFTNCWTGCCDMVQSAILEIRLRAHPTDSLTVTDSLQFREDGVGVASFLISSLPGTGGTWNPGQTATLFLDLGALNPAIITSMQDGDLDVMVQDDTGVDYMCLTVVACPCPNPIGVSFIQGNIDNMITTDGPEPTTPSVELQTHLNQCFNSINSYDIVPCNACIGDSFTNLPPCIISANLTIGLCTNGICNSSNDTLSLEVLDPFGSPVYAWGKSIASLSGQTWNTQQCTTLSLDLANLPPSGSGVQNILSYLQDGDLDVRVQDDTGIDYMFLDIQYCECQPCPGDITPVGGNGVVNIDDLVAVLNAFGPCPPAPTPCPADIVPLPNGNGVVNIDDLVAVLNGFGPCP